MRITRRIQRVEAMTEQRQVHAMAHRIAAAYGVTVDDVMSEARRIRDEAWMQGVAPEVIVARECGLTVELVRAEANQVCVATRVGPT